MLTLDNCLAANRPCIFVVCESDVEVLRYLDEKYNKANYSVYSTTLARVVKLSDLMKTCFVPPNGKGESTLDVLSGILSRSFHDSNNRFESYIFLDADSFINDRQIIRKIKDILSRYQLDTNFTVNLIFVSQTVCVPPQLERLSEVVFYDLPTEQQLKEQSEAIIGKLEIKKDLRPTDEVVNNLKGLTLFEVEQAYLQSWQLYQKIDLDFIREFKKASIAKTDLLSLMETNLGFDDIGGLDTLKTWITKSSGGWTVEGKKFGLPLLKGLLLVGLPGCGKSLCAKALGTQWGLPLISFDPSRIFSSRVGESEGNIRRVLQIVANISPCILFIDEIEKGFAGSQSSTFSDSGVTARVIGSFLTWMQDCTEPVFVIATSNNIQYLPPELIQRFDEKFFVNLPQMQERVDIYRIHLKRLGRDPGKFDLEALAQHSQDLSGREIEQTLREAMYDAYSQTKDIDTTTVLKVLGKKTSLITTMSEQLKYTLDWVGWDSEKKDGIRARFAHPAEEESVTRVKDMIDKLIDDVDKNKPTP
jgi:AAA+ superfamily predicted ATPase